MDLHDVFRPCFLAALRRMDFRRHFSLWRRTSPRRRSLFSLVLTALFRCVLASLIEDLSVQISVGPSVFCNIFYFILPDTVPNNIFLSLLMDIYPTMKRIMRQTSVNVITRLHAFSPCSRFQLPAWTCDEHRDFNQKFGMFHCINQNCSLFLVHGHKDCCLLNSTW